MYLEYIKSAIASIRSNKGRSFLTMLGIIIGISAVLTVLIIGDGMKETVNGEIDSMGASSINVSLDNTKTDKSFTMEQLDIIDESLTNIIGVSAQLSGYGTVSNGRNEFDLMLEGKSEVEPAADMVKMVHGRYFNKTDVTEGKYYVVLSQTAAKTLFGYEEAMGNFIDVDLYGNMATLAVIGVREDTSLDKAYAMFGDTPTLSCDLPFTTLADIEEIDLEKYLTSFTIYADSEEKDAVLSKAKAVVENVAGLRGENAVKVSSGYGFDATTDTILNIITSVVAIIAAISLLVGGIGVMNIMTVSVTERTREIGIRKSLGARTSSILTQFLAEAAILTFTGGVIGIIFGLTVSFIICKVIDFTFTVNPVLVAVVVLISTAIGLFFGIYPAKRAANLDPIEALRTE
jgi:putative ABC transport system permease protein